MVRDSTTLRTFAPSEFTEISSPVLPLQYFGWYGAIAVVDFLPAAALKVDL